jgi:hypothetical protein
VRLPMGVDTRNGEFPSDLVGWWVMLDAVLSAECSDYINGGARVRPLHRL